MHTEFQTLHRKLATLGITPAEWQAVSETVVKVERLKGHSLPYLRGDFFFVSEGLLKQTYVLNGAPVVERFLHEGTSCFITWTDHQDIEVLEDAVLLKISNADLRHLKHTHPVLNIMFVQLYAEWMEMLKKRLELVLELKEDRVAAFQAAFPGLGSRLSKIDLARYLDIKTGYVSGVINDRILANNSTKRNPLP
ncbi:Crp/Fnr family transcriptional regulator [Parapedobacter deserti]|uniref:Crp/Fnr family transcriptional regulator n=1 Tax=Parapedobacter deserti TaxID=1912957 RepID=A0ABV7JK22_9SPHI